MTLIDADTDTDDTGGTDHPAPAPGRSPLRGVAGVLAAALAVVLVAALAVSVYEWRHYESRSRHLSALAAIESSALQAADGYAVDLGSYNYANLHGPTAPWTLIEDNSTPSFKAKYEQTTSLLESTVIAYRGSATASVSASAVSSVKGDQVVVLTELDQKIVNDTQKSGPETQTFLVTITMLHQHGKWVIDDVQASL
jgi:hypothetical protein